GVSIHADIRGVDDRKGGSLHAGMTVAAIDSVVSHMMFMAELHRLFACDVLPRHIRRACRLEHRQHRKTHDKNKREDTKSGDEICASMKNLGHVRFLHFGGERTEWALRLGRPTYLTGKCKNPGQS